jgi:hypothetical protein
MGPLQSLYNFFADQMATQVARMADRVTMGRDAIPGAGRRGNVAWLP